MRCVTLHPLRPAFRTFRALRLPRRALRTSRAPLVAPGVALPRPEPLRWLAAGVAGVMAATAGRCAKTEIRKPETHRRQYEYMRLENGMQVMVNFFIDTPSKPEVFVGHWSLHPHAVEIGILCWLSWQVLLASDSSCDRAACALCVGVGRLHEPKEWMGRWKKSVMEHGGNLLYRFNT